MSELRTEARRRDFFRWLAREGAVMVDEAQGVRHYRLSDLGTLPPGQFASLKPRLVPGVSIVPGDGAVLARVPGREDAVQLFPTDPAVLAIFNGFNGVNTVAQVADAIEAETRLPREVAFAAVRGLFLRLVRLGVAAPSNQPSAI
jgi:hypothetical protein